MPQARTENKRRKARPAGTGRTFASHTALMQDMREFQRQVTSTPDKALSFLQRAGLVTASGKPKQLIRG
jgi:hypothetical protein